MRDHFFDKIAIVITQNDKADFYKAVRIFVCTILDSEMPRDVQYVYLAPGILKDLLASADETMGIVCIIVEPTIDVATTVGDWDATDATDATTSQNAEAVVAEVTAR